MADRNIELVTAQVAQTDVLIRAAHRLQLDARKVDPGKLLLRNAPEAHQLSRDGPLILRACDADALLANAQGTGNVPEKVMRLPVLLSQPDDEEFAAFPDLKVGQLVHPKIAHVDAQVSAYAVVVREICLDAHEPFELK